MEIKHGQNRFYIENESTEIAEITFIPQNNNTIIIDHTFVDPSLRGQGVAKQLLDEVVRYAREKNLKIIPMCSYAVTAMKRDQSMQDVLA